MGPQAYTPWEYVCLDTFDIRVRIIRCSER